MVKKIKVLPYSLTSVWPRADPGVQAVSPMVTFKVIPSSRLPLLSARPAVTFPAKERCRPSTSTKLYCLVTEVHGCEQLPQGCYTDGRCETQTLDLNDRKSNARPVVPVVEIYNCRVRPKQKIRMRHVRILSIRKI